MNCSIYFFVIEKDSELFANKWVELHIPYLGNGPCDLRKYVMEIVRHHKQTSVIIVYTSYISRKSVGIRVWGSFVRYQS